MNRRSVARLSLATILLGAATNLSVAWGLPLALPGAWPAWSASSSISDSGWSWQGRNRLLGDWIMLTRSSGFTVDWGAPPVSSTGGSHPPHWTAIPPDDGSFTRADTGATGWPMRCLASEAFFSSDSQIGIVYRWNLDLGANAQGAILLPLRPLPVGFVINTLVYAAMWYVVFQLVGRARSQVRRHYGHCPKCGYDLQHQLGKGCSECGWRR